MNIPEVRAAFDKIREAADVLAGQKNLECISVASILHGLMGLVLSEDTQGLYQLMELSARRCQSLVDLEKGEPS